MNQITIVVPDWILWVLCPYMIVHAIVALVHARINWREAQLTRQKIRLMGSENDGP